MAANPELVLCETVFGPDVHSVFRSLHMWGAADYDSTIVDCEGFRFILAYLNGVAVGYLIVTPAYRLWSEIADIVVHDDYKRQGIARAMMNSVLIEPRHFIATVHHVNKPSIDFHLSMGFELTAFLPHHYLRGSHAAVLTRRHNKP